MPVSSRFVWDTGDICALVVLRVWTGQRLIRGCRFGLHLQYLCWDTLHTLWAPKPASTVVCPDFLNVPCSHIGAVGTDLGHQIIQLQLLKELSCPLCLMSLGSLLPRPSGDQTWFPVRLVQHKRSREGVERGMTDGETTLCCKRASNYLLISSEGDAPAFASGIWLGGLRSRADAEWAPVSGGWDFLGEEGWGRQGSIPPQALLSLRKMVRRFT